VENRRGFLRLAGLAGLAVAAGGAAGCTVGGRPTGTSTTPAPTMSTPPPTTVGPPDWAALRSRLAGELLLPADQGYDAARVPYNEVYAGRRPAAIARCATVADVQACVETARTSRTPTAARGGGHSYGGYSTPEQGLVVDVGAMDRVTVNQDGTATVQAGARLIDVYAGLAQHGRALAAGSCPTVGVAGLTLGGGQGVLARKYGLTCDQLDAVEVVLADSTTTTATTARDGDLFWALRGGGGGNLGIVTAFTFRTAPAPEVIVFSLRFPAGSAPDVLGAWAAWIAAAPDELWSNCVISAGSPPACRVGGCLVGGRPQADTLIDDLVTRAGAQPSQRNASGRGYLDAMRYFAGCSTTSVEQCGEFAPEAFVGSSRIMRSAPAEPAAVVDVVDGRQGIDLLVDSLGGAVARVGTADTAFPHRSALAAVQVYASGTDPAPVAEVQAALATAIGTGAYVNYIDPGQQDWAAAYYGDNLPRLREAVTKYDPDHVFDFAQGLTRAG
jgi:hypothetical protein